MKQNARLQIRCEEGWYSRLYMAALRENMSVSEYVRTCIALGEKEMQKKEKDRRS